MGGGCRHRRFKKQNRASTHLTVADDQDTCVTWLKGGEVQKARWLHDKEVDFSSHEVGGQRGLAFTEGKKTVKTPVLQWEMAASPAWKLAMEDGAGLDL